MGMEDTIMVTTEKTRFGITTERKDDRTNKRYAREVHFAIYIEDRTLLARDLPWGEFNAENMPPVISRALGLMAVRPFKTDSSNKRGDSQQHWLHYILSAAKPSEILSEEAAIESLDRTAADALRVEYQKPEKGGEYLFTLAMSVIRETLMTQDAVLAKVAQRSSAVSLARFAAHTANEQARGIVRFEQRLAGLVAELEAEQAAQLKMLLDKGTLEKEAADYNAMDPTEATPDPIVPIEPKTVEIAKKYAHKWMPVALPRGLRGTGQSDETRIPLTEM